MKLQILMLGMFVLLSAPAAMGYTAYTDDGVTAIRDRHATGPQLTNDIRENLAPVDTAPDASPSAELDLNQE